MGGDDSDRRRRWRNHPLVREPDEGRRRLLWFFLAVVFAIATPVISYLVQQMEYVRVRYRIEETRAQYSRLEEQEQRLRIRRARLVTPGRVEQRAIRDLGLVRPSTDEVIVVRRPGTADEDLMARAPDRP